MIHCYLNKYAISIAPSFSLSRLKMRSGKKKKKNIEHETDYREKKMKALIFSQKLDSNMENTVIYQFSRYVMSE